jgi:hypothetical protein
MATFGQTGDGGNSSTSSADSNLVNRSTEANSVCPTDGTLDSIKARLWVDSGSCLAKGLMYDSSGNLLAVGDEITISNTTEQELTLPFSGAERISLVNGTSYSYGVMWDDPGAGNINWSRQSVASTSLKNSITYPTPEDPIGSGTVSGPVDMYVEYTESARNITGISSIQGIQSITF